MFCLTSPQSVARLKLRLSDISPSGSNLSFILHTPTYHSTTCTSHTTPHTCQCLLVFVRVVHSCTPASFILYYISPNATSHYPSPSVLSSIRRCRVISFLLPSSSSVLTNISRVSDLAGWQVRPKMQTVSLPPLLSLF